MSMSISFQAGSREAMDFFTAALSRTSNDSFVTLVTVDSSFSNRASRSFLRPQRIRSKSWGARSRAVASPMPEVAPVMSAILLRVMLLENKINGNGVRIESFDGDMVNTWIRGKHIDKAPRKPDLL